MVDLPEADIKHAGSLLRNAKHAIALTGAGISTPSGIPDFRSAQTGLWKKDNPMEVASLSAFRYRPERFFDWLRPLVKTAAEAVPNPAHTALAQLEQAGVIKAVITQNIDFLHQKAGSQKVIPVHGTMNTLTCSKCSRNYPVEDFLEPFLVQKIFPLCPVCSAILKPDIVLFEEMLPMNAWQEAELHCDQADLILVIGSSLEVTPANSLPLYALRSGAALIINNFTPTYLDDQAEILFPYDVVDTIPRIADEVIHGNPGKSRP
jgi:NAD-dependent deacetylase